MPSDLFKKRFETALKNYGFKDEEAQTLTQSFYKHEQHTVSQLEQPQII